MPLSTLVKTDAIVGPEVIYRYNRYRAVKILGSAAPGYSSGPGCGGNGGSGANNFQPDLVMSGLALFTSRSCRKAKKVTRSVLRPFWCSCFWPRSMKAGRRRSR